MVSATVIADASWCPHTKAAGWAAWVVINHTSPPRVQRVQRYGRFHQRPKSSTEAELWAAWNGIWIAHKLGATDVLCQTDCLSVVQHPGSGRRGHSYPEVSKRYWPGTKVTFRHVKGHTSNPEPRFYVNRWCDTHARKVMKAQRDAV
jgi:ribonuclease HI